jgi:hypothetical protein
MTQSQPRTDVLSEKRIARERCAVYRVYAGVILETIDSCADVTPPSLSVDKYAMLLSL